MTLFVENPRFDLYRSDPLSYIDGVFLALTHDFLDLDLSQENLSVQIQVICQVSEYGYAVGERVLIDRGVSIAFSETQITIQISEDGLLVERKNGNNKTVALTPANWKLCVIGERQ